jgi:hypothetical protein
MRAWQIPTVLVLAVGLAACGGSTSVPASPSPAATPGSTIATGASAATGTWVGTAVDSSGATMGMSMGSMGMGMPGGPMGEMTWLMTQTGNTFTGTVSFANYRGNGTMTVSGTINGRTGTFTMTMPTGTMPMAGCGGQVTGTFDMDDMMVQMRGTYSGSTTCSGPFDHGQMTMTRR